MAKQPREPKGFWDTFWGLVPIALLIAMTFRGWPTSKSLPTATAILYLVALVYYKFEPNLINATVVKGVVDSFTTISIVFGAICLFEALKMTRVLDWLTGKLRTFSRGNQTAEVFLIAWAFAYLIEGCSGFGTPTALAAPLLVEIGYDATAAVMCCLVMNTLATPFGAAGTPIWFGLDGLDIDDDGFETVGFWAQCVCFSAAHVVPLIAATHLVSPRAMARNWKTVLVCVYCCSGLALAVAAFSYELPTLLGGGIGLLVAAMYVKSTNTPPRKMLREMVDSVRSLGSSIRGSGSSSTRRRRRAALSDDDDDDGAPTGVVEMEGAAPAAEGVPRRRAAADDDDPEAPADFDETAKQSPVEDADDADRTPRAPGATNGDDAAVEAPRANDDEDEAEETALTVLKNLAPLGLVVFFLTLTRFPELDLKDELKSQRPKARARLGSFGKGWISAALVIGVEKIFREPSVTATFEFLYVPGILPFIAVSVLTMLLFEKRTEIPELFRRTWARTQGVVVPVVAALVLAALMRAGVAQKIARPMMSHFGKAGWIIVTPLFGILGSFFSGSTTVSNLSFGIVQVNAAKRLGFNKLHLLALQTAGATIGNCVCLQNIISAKAVVGLQTSEAEIIKKTWKPAALFCAIAWVWGYVFLALG
mmetsp:Transcript_26710/g.106953  ORF Transcript_26710/g.106953 Transcript_26710/m.106953 type:complete len:649 (+) Transcript_26710:76-2022(+)